MKIYTRTGDKGTSGLNDGRRATKDCIIYNVLGELDELTSRIGVLITSMDQTIETSMTIIPKLREIQKNIHKINAHVASPSKKEGKYLPEISEDIVVAMENNIDAMETFLPKLTHFIAPGTFTPDALCHMCRTQSRKVERDLWKLVNHVDTTIISNKDIQNLPRDYIISDEVLENYKIEVNPVIFMYMNRMSDFFFVLSRLLCLQYGGKDIEL